MSCDYILQFHIVTIKKQNHVMWCFHDSCRSTGVRTVVAFVDGYASKRSELSSARPPTGATIVYVKLHWDFDVARFRRVHAYLVILDFPSWLHGVECYHYR